MIKKISDDVFEKTLKQLAKQFGDGCYNRGLAEINPKAIPTGHDDLDDVLTKGARGVYLGGIVELFGNEAGGKTSLALRIVGMAQKAGMRCAWFDCEAAFDEGVAILNGVDPTQLILPELAQTSAVDDSDANNDQVISLFNVNKILEMVYAFVVSKSFSVIVLDSVAGLMPERILEKDSDPNKVGVAEVARAMSDKLRKIAPACRATETSVIFINQKRDQPGAYYQNPNHTPGGRALKFFAQQRISLEKINGKDGEVYAEIEGKKELIGHYARIKIVKNRKAPPLPPDVNIEIPIYYRKHFPDNAEKCYQLGRQLQVIKTRHGVLTWKEDDNIILQSTGESSFLNSLREQKLESRLAASCVLFVDGGKGKDKEVFISNSIRELAKSTATAAALPEDTKIKKIGKSRKMPAISI